MKDKAVEEGIGYFEKHHLESKYYGKEVSPEAILFIETLNIVSKKAREEEREKIIKLIEQLHNDYTFKPILAVKNNTTVMNFIDLIKEKLKKREKE